MISSILMLALSSLFVRPLPSIAPTNKFHQRQVDHWEWIHCNKGKYVVFKAYKVLLSRREGIEQNIRERTRFSKLWKSWAVRKATTTAWKILKDRMATTDNLGRRGISLSSDELKCQLCKEQDESISHLFFNCKLSSQLWLKILSWLGVSSALHEDPTKHFLQFGHCLGKGIQRKAATTIWIATVWRIWITMNEIIFNKGIFNLEKEMCIIKSNVWN